MATHHHTSKQSDRFILPITLAVLVTLVLELSNFSLLNLSWSIGYEAGELASAISKLTAVALTTIAGLTWTVYFRAIRSLKAHRDSRTTWLAVGTTITCFAAAVVVLATAPAVRTESSDATMAATMLAHLVSLTPALYFSITSALSLAALSDALRATDKARRL